MDFAIAASYYHERNMNLSKAKKLQEMSMALREAPSAWAYNSYGVILNKLGDLEEAKEAIRYSLELARESNEEYLIEENLRLLNEWEN